MHTHYTLYYKLTQESVSVLQVHYVWMCNEIRGSYDKISVPEEISWAWLIMLHNSKNTDGNKVMIFSGIALYYGDQHLVCDASASGLLSSWGGGMVGEYQEKCGEKWMLWMGVWHIFKPHWSKSIFGYTYNSANNKWSKLPRCPNFSSV